MTAATDTATKLRSALADNPNSDAKTLAAKAEIGNSTAGKLLAAWANEGTVTKTAVKGQAATYAPVAVDADQAAAYAPEPTDASETLLGSDDYLANAQAQADARIAEDIAYLAERAAEDETPAADEAPVDADAETDRVADEATIAALTPAQRRALIAMHRAGLGDMLTLRAARVAAKVAAPKATTPRAAVANGTLPAMNRGGLRAEVVAHLTANPTLEITPSKLAKALGGRSSGAVANALAKLVEAGTVVQTSDAPRTYRLA